MSKAKDVRDTLIESGNFCIPSSEKAQFFTYADDKYCAIVFEDGSELNFPVSSLKPDDMFWGDN